MASRISPSLVRFLPPFFFALALIVGCGSSEFSEDTPGATGGITSSAGAGGGMSGQGGIAGAHGGVAGSSAGNTSGGTGGSHAGKGKVQ